MVFFYIYERLFDYGKQCGIHLLICFLNLIFCHQNVVFTDICPVKLSGIIKNCRIPVCSYRFNYGIYALLVFPVIVRASFQQIL